MDHNQQITAQRLRDEAVTEVRSFFEQTIDPLGRDYFKRIASSCAKDLFNEVNDLRKTIDTPKDLQDHGGNCSLYVRKSKQLIRAVSFEVERWLIRNGKK